MKTNFCKKIVTVLIAIAIGVCGSLQAQTFTYTIQNVSQTASNVLEFDLYLLNKDAGTPIEISGIQAGITLNSAIVNGGTITAELVAGSSDLVSAEQPTAITYASATYCIKIAAKSGPGAGSGTVVSTTAPGTRYCKVRLTNTVAFATALPTLTFSFTTIPYATKLYAYMSGISTQLTSDATNTYNATNNDVLNEPIIRIDSIKNIGATSAIGYATITALGYPASISSYGVCYSSTNSTPTIVDNIVDKGATTNAGTFTASITGLTANTTYYVRTFATNSAGTSYGSVETFTTSSITNLTASPFIGMKPKVYVAEGKLIVDLTQISGEFKANVFDVTGRAIHQKNVSGGNRYTITLNSKGTYVINMVSDSNQYISKVLY